MFPIPESTAYDLRFQLLGIPVRVAAWFWLLAAFLGFSLIERSLELFIVWMLVVFVSLMVHEFGHALLAKAFGYEPRVLLYHFGGLAMFEPDGRYTRSKSIAMSLAGPAAGFTLFAASLVASMFLPQLRNVLAPNIYLLVANGLEFLIIVNLVWNVFNLLPILPLDGGNVSKEICSYFSPYKGLTIAAQIGAVVAGVICAWFVMQQSYYNAFLMGMFCSQNISIAQSQRW